MIKKLLVSSALVILFLLTPRSSFAIYDPRVVPNNIVGIHILHPSEVSEVTKFTNNNQGDWGYVTVPIQPTDRDQDKWQLFMHSCRELHLIPIIRITTIPLGGTWGEGSDTDLVDFANFLNELDWPTENRYIVLFNEVNRDTEWGGKVDPASYTRIARNAASIFKERSRDFFLLGPALDSALPDSSTSLSASSYIRAMTAQDGSVWEYFDGWASHSYPNPGFIASPYKTGWQSIVSYQTETYVARASDKPIFITETGWDQSKLSDNTLYTYWDQALRRWEADPNVVAVTPFVLSGGGQFPGFSLIEEGGNISPSGRALISRNKTRGEPHISEIKSQPQASSTNSDHQSSNSSSYTPSIVLLRLDNFFRSLLGLQKHAYLKIGGKTLFVELAETPKGWEKGLSDRGSFENLGGMLFLFPEAHNPVFWMKNMHFPIDILWLKDSVIVGVENSVPATSESPNLPTYSPDKKVNMVLELPDGYFEANDLQLGDLIEIIR